MLVITRLRNESIVIGDDVRITIVEVREGDRGVIRDVRVRLGFEAPLDVPIHREEVYEAIHEGASNLPELRRAEMLMLSRKRDERLLIGKMIVLTVVEVQQKPRRFPAAARVRIGIQSLPQSAIRRAELT